MPEPIGFIGLGHMGLPMAANLLAAGFPMRVYNRTRDRARTVVDAGAQLVNEPSQVAVSGGVVISMVADDRALEAVATTALAQALGEGGIHLSMSTVLPETSDRLAAHHARHGVAFVAAPVFGRPEAAAARKVWIATSGPASSKKRLNPVLSALCQGVFDFGDRPGAANVVKLATNFAVYASLESLAEASALAEKQGIPRAALLGMLTGTLFNCYAYQVFSRRVIDADFDQVAFRAALALKDLTLARETASAGGAPMPILALLCERFASAIAKGHGDLDASVLARGAAEDAGLNW